MRKRSTSRRQAAADRPLALARVAPWGPLAALMLGAAALPAAAEVEFGPLTRGEQERVERGEILVQVEQTQDPLKSFRAVGMIKAPVTRVYAAFTDFEHYASIFHLKESQVLSRQGNRLEVRAVMGIPWPIGDRWVTNETLLMPERHTFSFKRILGTILQYEGTIQAIPRGPALTQVYYAAKGDPGVPFMPAWLLNMFQARLLPDAIQRVRHHLGTQQAAGM